MYQPRKLERWVLLPLILAVGVATLWGIAGAWLIQYLETLAQSSGVYEQVQIATNGTPVIQAQRRRSGPQLANVSFRMLDGTLWTGDKDWLQPATLARSAERTRWFRAPIGWQGRQATFHDPQQQTTIWYLIRDAQPAGRAYFIGYDRTSKLPIGFIGRRGFRSSLPPGDEQFEIGPRKIRSGSAYASTSYTVTDAPIIPPWFIYLIDGEAIVEIDLRKKASRTVLQVPHLVSIGMLDETVPSKDEATAGNGSRERMVDSGEKMVRLAVRASDRIILLDPTTDESQEFPLPPSLAERDLSVYSLGQAGILCLRRLTLDVPWTVELYWLQKGGELARREGIELAGFSSVSPAKSMLMLSAAAPEPLLWAFNSSIFAPLIYLRDGQGTSYGDALAQCLQDAWPALLVVTLAAGCLAAWTWHLSRRSYCARPALWVVFVFLLGVPGFIAYWLHHRRPPLAACAHCGKRVPRDQEACAACAAPFPSPAPLGTEIIG